MSQEKVDRYKNEKANRQKIQKREKRVFFLEKMAALLICAVVVGWIGYSAYGVVTREDTSEQEATVTEMDIDAITDYLQNLRAE